MNEICQVHISMDKKRNSFWGLITGFDDNIYFDPFTVLTELRYKPDAIELEDDFFDDWDYSHEYAFGCQLSLSDYERKQYVYVVKGIKKLIKKSYSEHETIRLADLELLKSYFDITFNFTPIATIIKPKSLIPSERIAHNLSVHYSSFSIDHILNIGTKLYSECYRYTYLSSRSERILSCRESFCQGANTLFCQDDHSICQGRMLLRKQQR
ncbi:hypothetical protein SAMN02910406_03636 [Ruminococcus albus]|uniref:Uncharacterized protein n=2 Tax=Ruminococcus albus TaxID=1264 RepID=A0A1I1R9J8_RUMAL|nr:hypothetical protein SAMN02910406_03636 [Ruminococcus albus]